MEEKMIESFDGTKLYMRKDLPDGFKAVVVVVHGLCEHQGRYDYLANRFNASGLATYRFDHRGHGRSEGERTFYSDFNELFDDTNVIVDMAISENPGKPVFLLGHSMGGFTVVGYGIKYPNKLRGIVTSGALVYDHQRLISDMPAGMDIHAHLPNELGSGVCSVKEVVEKYGTDPLNTMFFTPGLVYALQKGSAWVSKNIKDFSYPVLMLHGEKDGLVSVKDTYQSFNEVSSIDKQMKIYGRLFHEIFNEYCRNEVIDDAAGWIKNRI